MMKKFTQLILLLLSGLLLTTTLFAADSDWQEIYKEAKEDFVKEFEEFKKQFDS